MGATGVSCKGRLVASTKDPVRGSTRPGRPMPMLSTFSRAIWSRQAASRFSSTAAPPRSAPVGVVCLLHTVP